MINEILFFASSILLSVIVALIIGYFFGRLKESRKLDQANSSVERIISMARRDAEQLMRDSQIKLKEEYLSKKQKFEESMRNREEGLSDYEKEINKREIEVKKIQNSLADQEADIESRDRENSEARERIAKKAENLDAIIESQNQKLEQISGVSKSDAIEMLKENLTEKAKAQAAHLLYEIRQEVKNTANREAKEIIATAIENVATDYVQESTLASVSLPNDKIKGLIIGKEGRNIKAFENCSNVKVIVDDTPETVVLSSFDPVKREIARVAMSRLIKEKNINPKTIESLYNKAKNDVEKEMAAAAEATLSKLQLKNVHPELKQMLGRLKYRTSYGQNILHHSTEVALLAGKMAAELNLDVELAKRAGLFHDIGKAISNDTNASHVELGVEITTRCNEHPVVINSVLAHHEEADPIAPEAVLVTASDKISGARPGARRESLEAYTQRIEKLEELANSFDGVAKTFALSAGREIRVIVEPENVTDETADMLAQDIAEKIEGTLEYPGQIKVTVLRRLITTQYTDFQRKGYNGENVAGVN